MKRGLSLVLCIAMLVSVFAVCSVSVSAASAKDALEVTKTAFKDGVITFDIYLKADVSISGAIIRVEYDSDVLEPANDYELINGKMYYDVAYKTKNAYGEEINSVSGVYTAGVALNDENIFSIGFAQATPYVTTAKRGFITLKFKVTDDSRPVTDIDIYCVEFNSEDSSLNIPKNETNPQVLYSFSGTTLDQIKLSSVRSVEDGLRVSWEKTEGATGYKIYDMTNSSSPVYLGSTTRLFYDDLTVEHGEIRYYTVRAYNGSASADSGYAGKIRGMYVQAPENFSIAAQTNGVKVNWSLVDGAKYYKIYRREIYSDGTKSGWTEVYNAGSTEVSCVDSSVPSGKQYEYTIRAFTDIGACEVCRFATTWFFTAPTVTTTAVTGGVSVKWNAISGANTYRIYRKYNGEKSWTCIKIVSGDVTSYLDAEATSGRNIFYTVRAFGKNNEGSSKFIAKKIAYVGVPHLTSVANSVNGITVKWSAVENATGYRVYRRAAGEKYFTYLGTVTSTTYLDKTVENGVYYKYTVRTVFYSLFSNYESGLLCKCVDTPKLKTIKNVSSGINITWNSIDGATGYRVYRRGAGQTTWTYLGTVTDTAYTDTSVKDASGQYFRYTVRAVSGYYSGFDTNGLYIKRS